MPFVEIEKIDPDAVISVYQHIDNGGYTISISRHGDVTIETGFFGYSNTRVQLTGVDLDSFSAAIELAKSRIEEIRLVEALSGKDYVV